MSSYIGFLKVYLSKNIEINPMTPKTPGGIQEFIPACWEKNIIYGARVLPTVPIALVQPKPILLTFVGYISAT